MAEPDLGDNLVQLFTRRVAERGDAPMLWAKREGAWRPWSWRQVDAESRAIAATLVDAGLEPGDRVLLVSENRPEWCIADLAIMRAGGVTVPGYTTNSAEDHRYLLEHSEARLAICSGPALARRLMPAVAQVPDVRRVLLMEPLDGWLARATLAPWAEAVAQGAGLPPVDRAADLGPDDLACFIYTSGTGGRPKGVMLSHRNILANVRGVWSVLERLGLEDAVFLSFLPLSHAYEHTAGQFLPIAAGAQIYYAEGVEALSRNLAEVRPTILPCVPRLYEVMRLRILHSVERMGGLHAWLFRKAVELGARRHEEGGLGLPERLLDLALDRLVRAKVRERFGGRLKAMVSGGAPLNYEVGLFFTALGLPVAQGYGQTEAAPLISVNPPWRSKLRTVGPPVDGVELRIAEDGEILVRGELVMRGYWKDPEATALALRDGWLHTGDIGELDGDGYLVITDRKKDIIVLSGGDNVAPQRIEGMLLLEPEIAQAAVFGNRKPWLAALIVPSEALLRALPAGERPPHASPALHKRIAAAVGRANAKLNALERVRKFALLPEPCTVDNGLMTPTMKLRRHALAERYGALLDELFGEAGKAA
jgi:long-chain acyl-CoA synthetase